MVRVSLSIHGADKVINSLRIVGHDLGQPGEGRERIAQRIAKDLLRGSQLRYFNRGFMIRTGKAYRSMKVASTGEKGSWTFYAGGGVVSPGGVPYFGVLEGDRVGGGPRVIRGWHFKPKPGTGEKGEGFSLPGGNIVINVPGGFVADAFFSTARRARRIAEREVQRTINRAGAA